VVVCVAVSVRLGTGLPIPQDSVQYKCEGDLARDPCSV